MIKCFQKSIPALRFRLVNWRVAADAQDAEQPASLQPILDSSLSSSDGSSDDTSSDDSSSDDSDSSTEAARRASRKRARKTVAQPEFVKVGCHRRTAHILIPKEEAEQCELDSALRPACGFAAPRPLLSGQTWTPDFGYVSIKDAADCGTGCEFHTTKRAQEKCKLRASSNSAADLMRAKQGSVFASQATHFAGIALQFALVRIWLFELACCDTPSPHHLI